MTGLVVVVALLAGATVFGVWFTRRSGRIRDRVRRQEPSAGLLAQALDGRLGQRATIVQFSSAFCAPCRATRRIIEEVTAFVPGVAHVEIDAEDNLDLVRELDVRRTPTVLMLDSAGIIRKSASGQPRKADVIAAVGELVLANEN